MNDGKLGLGLFAARGHSTAAEGRWESGDWTQMDKQLHCFVLFFVCLFKVNQFFQVQMLESGVWLTT